MPRGSSRVRGSQGARGPAEGGHRGAFGARAYRARARTSAGEAGAALRGERTARRGRRGISSRPASSTKRGDDHERPACRRPPGRARRHFRRRDPRSDSGARTCWSPGRGVASDGGFDSARGNGSAGTPPSRWASRSNARAMRTRPRPRRLPKPTLSRWERTLPSAGGRRIRRDDRPRERATSEGNADQAASYLVEAGEACTPSAAGKRRSARVSSPPSAERRTIITLLDRGRSSGGYGLARPRALSAQARWHVEAGRRSSARRAAEEMLLVDPRNEVATDILSKVGSTLPRD